MKLKVNGAEIEIGDVNDSNKEQLSGFEVAIRILQNTVIAHQTEIDQINKVHAMYLTEICKRMDNMREEFNIQRGKYRKREKKPK